MRSTHRRLLRRCEHLLSQSGHPIHHEAPPCPPTRAFFLLHDHLQTARQHKIRSNQAKNANSNPK
jgi:hypothetical protein